MCCGSFPTLNVRTTVRVDRVDLGHGVGLAVGHVDATRHHHHGGRESADRRQRRRSGDRRRRAWVPPTRSTPARRTAGVSPRRRSSRRRRRRAGPRRALRTRRTVDAGSSGADPTPRLRTLRVAATRRSTDRARRPIEDSLDRVGVDLGRLHRRPHVAALDESELGDRRRRDLCHERERPAQPDADPVVELVEPVDGGPATGCAGSPRARADGGPRPAGGSATNTSPSCASAIEIVDPAAVTLMPVGDATHEVGADELGDVGRPWASGDVDQRALLGDPSPLEDHHVVGERERVGRVVGHEHGDARRTGRGADAAPASPRCESRRPARRAARRAAAAEVRSPARGPGRRVAPGRPTAPSGFDSACSARPTRSSQSRAASAGPGP